ncbi:flagellar basal-body MS-ring/collar protein FliF [Oceanobacillus sp. 1P07AA]|uniref:flagellar basal-body MS-ring/collar protein FliF n=1 Tax=Oceanobacillus sp. 1P07AA TaxID=3132293 RepID=UPI0039A63C76
MKEKFLKGKDSLTSFWTSRSKVQKGSVIGGFLLIILLIGVITFASTNTNYVPLYNNLSTQEAGQITTELESRGVPFELENGRSTITVPEEQVDTLLLDLAAMGLPNNGSIDYSFFSENTSWGITDNEFNVMKLDAMQTELANLIKSVEGIQDAQVMINVPEEPVFATDVTGEASASIVLNTQPGYQFEGNQVEGLYHLVSKAVPNLPEENIVIMNQYFEYFDQNTQQAANQDTYTHQQTVKKEVERDIQRRLQQMLGTMVGNENIVVSVTADIDFTQENRTEELVEPVDIENMEGLPVSLETIQESYVGEGAAEAGEAGTGEEDVANYPAGDNGDGEYELDKETINYEFNRIRRDIVESPYKVRDLGIQVAVNNTRNVDDQVEYLSQQEQTSVGEGISSILNSIITSSIDGEFNEDLVPDDKTSIVFQEFTETTSPGPEGTAGIPTWLYVVAGILLLVIIVLLFFLIRNRKTSDEVAEEYEEINDQTPIPDLPEKEESEATIRRKQLEKIAKEKPEDFAKLLRSWIGED